MWLTAAFCPSDVDLGHLVQFVWWERDQEGSRHPSHMAAWRRWLSHCWWPLTGQRLPWLSVGDRTEGQPKLCMHVGLNLNSAMHLCVNLCAHLLRRLLDFSALIAYFFLSDPLGTSWSLRECLRRMQIRSFPWVSDNVKHDVWGPFQFVCVFISAEAPLFPHAPGMQFCSGVCCS